MYNNLRPEDAPTVRVGFRLEQRGERWVTVSGTGQVRTGSGRYLYVVLNGVILVARPARGLRTFSHVDLCGGQPVQYAGEIQFSGRSKRGRLRWWNNRSGHYAPLAADAPRTGLPLSCFSAWPAHRP